MKEQDRLRAIFGPICKTDHIFLMETIIDFNNQEKKKFSLVTTQQSCLATQQTWQPHWLEIDEESMRIWTFHIDRNFYICWLIIIFTISWFTPHFFLFKMLDGHLMHLISWKNLVLNTLFFLLRPLEYVSPIFLNEQKHEKISMINISSENG